MKFVDVIGYVLFQLAGAYLAAELIKVMAVDGHITGYDLANGLGQNGWGEGYAGGYNMDAAIIFEFIATFIFVKVILKTTSCDLRIAGVVIGLTLTVLHILGLPITGVSVNPARSFGPAYALQGIAMQQLWLFLVVPSVAGILAGICSRCCCCKCGDDCKCGCKEGKECTCGEKCNCKNYEPNLDAKPATAKVEKKTSTHRPAHRGAPRRKTSANRAK
jgi:glycerol uptake facilitator-like aquaporin